MVETLWSVITEDTSGLLVSLFFSATIILMVFDKQKPPLLTGILTGCALIILGLGGSYRAPIVAAVTIVNGFLWLILAWQRFKQTQPTTSTVPSTESI